MFRRFLSTVLLIGCLLVITRDSRFHFNRERIEEKRLHWSAVRHWSIYYSPKYVTIDSPFRYDNDIEKIRELIEPGFALLSDLATSYYAAATLPVYVRNIHRHHGLDSIAGLEGFLQRGHLCYLKDPYHIKRLSEYLQKDAFASKRNNWPVLKYILINKDKENSQLRRDCIAVHSKDIIDNLSNIAQLVYEGDYLVLFRLKTFY